VKNRCCGGMRERRREREREREEERDQKIEIVM